MGVCPTPAPLWDVSNAVGPPSDNAKYFHCTGRVNLGERDNSGNLIAVGFTTGLFVLRRIVKYSLPIFVTGMSALSPNRSWPLIFQTPIAGLHFPRTFIFFRADRATLPVTIRWGRLREREDFAPHLAGFWKVGLGSRARLEFRPQARRPLIAEL